jgi:hypothetical protein
MTKETKDEWIEITFKAPTRPLSTNESNRLHWAARHKRLKPWATWASIGYRAVPHEERKKLQGHKLTIYTTIPFPRKARRDPHNYIGTNVKTIIDALISEGIAPDDTAEYIEVIEPRLSIDKTNEVQIMIKVGAKLK